MSASRVLASIALVASLQVAVSADWPTHRADSGRTGASDDALTAPLHLAWSRQYAHAPSPSFRKSHIKEGFIPAITHDYADQAIVAQGKVFHGSSTEDCVRCLDVKSGEVLWTFYCDAAVRLAPTYADGKVYCGADDGRAYCLEADTGRQVWRHAPGQGQRWAINNGRFMSQWPVRTGVTVADGVAYFAAGLFPPHGVHLCAVDAETGRAVWDRKLGADYATAFQGHIMVDGDVMYVPTGRTSPVEVNRKDGSFVVDMPFDYRRSGGGMEAVVLAKDVVAFGPTSRGVINIRAGLEEYPSKYPIRVQGKPRGRVTSIFAQSIVSDRDTVYLLRTYRAPPGARTERGFQNALLALDKAKFLEALHAATGEQRPRFPNFGGTWFVWSEDRRIVSKLDSVTRWQQEVSPESLCMIKVGGALIIGGKDRLEVRDPKTGRQTWTSAVKGDVWSLAVSDSSLVASTDEGVIYCFRQGQAAKPVEHRPAAASPYSDEPVYRQAAELALNSTDREAGFCVVLDANEGQLACEIARLSEFYVLGLETDPDKVALARGKLTQAGLYGKRVVIHHCPADNVPYASYFANLIVADACLEGDGETRISYSAGEVFRMLRPYGGVCILGRRDADTDWRRYVETGWPGGGIPGWHALEGMPGYCQVMRGPLPGAGNWSHMYADPANAANSNDALVRGVEFDLQWMGPPGTERIINRHMTPMGPLYRDGRLFVFGYNYVTVVDAYNGTYLWERDIADSSRVIMALNAAPICVDERYFYSVSANQCWVMDAGSGETVRELTGPHAESDWGYIASTGSHVVGTNQNPKARMRRAGTKWNWQILYGDASGKPGAAKPVVSDVLFVMGAKEHKRLWQYEEGAILNSTITVADGAIYFAESREEGVRANGLGYVPLPEFVEKDAWFVALDLKTGDQIWRRPIDMQAKHVLYLVRAADDTLLAVSTYFDRKDTSRVLYGFRAMDAATGKDRWETVHRFEEPGLLTNETNHNQALMHPNIIGGKIVMNFYPGPIGVFDLATGRDESFNFKPRRCSPMSASATNGFYRAGYCGTYDFSTGKDAPVTRITRPSCWISMLPAGGLIMMPEYGSTSCNCGYPIQTSVVMAPRVESQMAGPHGVP